MTTSNQFLHGVFAAQTTTGKCPDCGKSFTTPEGGAVIMQDGKPICPDCSGERGRKLVRKMDAAFSDPAATTMLLHPDDHPSRKKNQQAASKGKESW